MLRCAFFLQIGFLVGAGADLRRASQVANSIVGRWFQLEGSGVEKEREGSRFLVRTFLSPHAETPLPPLSPPRPPFLYKRSSRVVGCSLTSAHL